MADNSIFDCPKSSHDATDVADAGRSPRVELGMDSAVTAEVNADGREGAAGRIASLGPEGAYLELSEDYPIGCSLNLCLRLPPSFSPMVCSAIVRSHSAGRGVGVEFTGLMPADRERIEKFVNNT